MARMTDEEADALDEKWTKDPPKPGQNGTGFFKRRNVAHMVAIDDISAKYLQSKVMASHKTPMEIIREMIQKEIATAV
jgi:hypothetical protein